MDKAKIIIASGEQKIVDGIFYLFDSKYFFMYTEKEVDENGYIVFHLVQVGKESKNTPSGPVSTGYMVGISVQSDEEWALVQQSISEIVNDKKNGTQSSQIQYLPIEMLDTLKVVSSRTFRLMKNLAQEYFKLDLLQEKTEEINNTISGLDNTVNNVLSENTQDLSSYIRDLEKTQVQLEDKNLNEIGQQSNALNTEQETQSDNVIVDYRARFFEEQEKNKQLEQKIEELNNLIDNIKNLIK